MHVFLGITGASGAPYAARLLEGFARAGAQVGVSASASAGEVIAWEIYRDRSIPPEEAVERFLFDAHQRKYLSYEAAGSLARLDFPPGDLEAYAVALTQRTH